MNNNIEALKKVSGKSIFFSKYFPAENSSESVTTFLHWKKIMTGMNADSQRALGESSTCTSSTVEVEQNQVRSDPIPSSSHAANTASSYIQQNGRSSAIVHNVKHWVCRDHTVGSGQESENCQCTSKDHQSGRGSQPGQKSMSWELSSGKQSSGSTVHPNKNDSRAVNGFHPPRAVGKGTDSSSTEGGSPDEVTSTSASRTRTPMCGLSKQPQLPLSDVDRRTAAFSLPSCSTDSKVPGDTELVRHGPLVSGDNAMCMGGSLIDSETGHSIEVQGGSASQPGSGLCQVCEDIAAGFYCGAFVCEACKKFFIRASKQDKQKFVCLRESMCKITKESRVHCQYCRYQKCLRMDMSYPGEGKKSMSSIQVSGIPCRVCSSPSSGFHFGALTCEGCKGFFRRMVKERQPGMYKCSSGGKCEISMHTRNMCKACRYQKCIDSGMSVEGSRIGRQPNALKHAISLEVKKPRLQQPSEQRGNPPTVYKNDKHVTEKDAQNGTSKNGTSSLDVEPMRACVEAPPDDGDGGCVAAVEVKDDPDSSVNLSNVELTEVHPEVVVKQEPENKFQEEELTSSLFIAGKELSNMCAVSRAKSETFNNSEFVSYPVMWKKQMKHFNFHAQCCIRFSKKVPGFKDVPLDDKVALVQNSVYSIVVLNHARDYDLETGFFNFFNFTKLEEHVILQMCPGYTTLQSHFRHMGIMAQTMQMTEMEFTLLSCLLLFDTDCPDLTSRSQVGQLQNHMMTYFQKYEIENHPDGPVRFGELLLRISELRLASEQHIQTIRGFLTQHPELEVPQMFKEMFF